MNACGNPSYSNFPPKNIIVVFEDINIYFDKIREPSLLECFVSLLSTCAEQSMIIATINSEKYNELVANPIIRDIFNNFMVLDLSMDVKQFTKVCREYFNRESNKLFQYTNGITVGTLINKAMNLNIKYGKGCGYKKFKKFIYKNAK
jgi:hypothetical protein